MRRLLLPVVVLGLLLTACGDDSGGDESFPEPDTTSAPLPEGVVVFTPNDTEIDPNGEPTTWTPEVDDVLTAEGVLPSALDAHATAGVGELETYVRQYVGVGPDDGHLVSVNALCDASLETLSDWEDELIVVADGGDCFWQATVNPQSGEVESFTVNGVA